MFFGLLNLLTWAIIVGAVLFAGMAIITGALAVVFSVVSILLAAAQIAGETALWAVYWMLELEIRKTWRPWKNWRGIFKSGAPDLYWFKHWQERRADRKHRRELAKERCSECDRTRGEEHFEDWMVGVWSDGWPRGSMHRDCYAQRYLHARA